MYAVVPPPVWLQLRTESTSLTPAGTAQNVLSRLGVVEPPVDVRAIAALLGIQTHFVHGVPWAGAVNSTSSAASIWIRGTDSVERQRFTLAHEMGHLMLHPLGVAFRDHTMSGGYQEVEANDFAANLLMPVHMLRTMLLFERDVVRLASRFHVSLSAMIVRLEVVTGVPRHQW